MLRGQSCFQLSAVEPITVSQTQSRSERTHSGPFHCVVSYWRIFIFAFKMSPELWFHSSKVEAFPNIGESQRWNTLPRPGMFAMSCSLANVVAAHVELGVPWKISSMMQGPKCSVLDELWKCCFHVQRASTRGYVAVPRCVACALWTCCDFMIKYCDSGLSGWLPWSSQLVVNIYTNFSIHSQCNLLTNSVTICKVISLLSFSSDFVVLKTWTTAICHHEYY